MNATSTTDEHDSLRRGNDDQSKSSATGVGVLVTLRTADMPATSLANERERYTRTPHARYRRSAGPYARHHREEGLTPPGFSSPRPWTGSMLPEFDSPKNHCPLHYTEYINTQLNVFSGVSHFP